MKHEIKWDFRERENRKNEKERKVLTTAKKD